MAIINSLEEFCIGLKDDSRCVTCGGELSVPFLMYCTSGGIGLFLCSQCAFHIKNGLIADLIQLAAAVELRERYPAQTLVRRPIAKIDAEERALGKIASDAAGRRAISLGRWRCGMTDLVKYNDASRALAEVVRVDEVKAIRDKAVAMQAYAKQAKDNSLIEYAIEIRLRAERRVGELLAEMEKNKGAQGTGSNQHEVRSREATAPPTLSDLGLSKSQSSRWQALAAIEPERFEAVITDACSKVDRARRSAVREVEIEAQREVYRARTHQGGSVGNLEALAASGFKAGVIYVDVPSSFEVYSGKGKQRSAERHYDTMSVEQLKAMGPLIQRLAQDDCELMYWTSGPQNAAALDIIKAWGFVFKTWAFARVKTKPSAADVVEPDQLDATNLHWGMGYGSRANVEVVLQATKGEPLRLDAGVHQVVIAPAREHSAKPEEVRRRIERLYTGPYLELFGRKPIPGWTVWGNEVVATAPDLLRARQQVVMAEEGRP